VHVVATAGHVDHGKSSVVHALTGAGLDRLAEERRRGLTIDLGFASMTTSSGRRIQFVDVPGHVRFLKNMLAGVGAVDACLFVVAATEAWKPQSEEHLRILELLGVGRGVIALTMADVVDGARLEAARAVVVEHVRGSFLEDAPIVAVDALSGFGFRELRRVLDQLAAATPVSADHGRARLWIDRTFARRGAGTVVTGTLLDGPLELGQDVEVVTVAGVLAARVRGLENFGEPHRSLPPGARAAVNLSGVHHQAAARGDPVVLPHRWHLTGRFDATLTVLDSVDHPVSRRGAFTVYIGSGEHPARLNIIGGNTIDPGARGLIRLTIPRRLPLLPGDRFVLRESGRGETIGGGEMLDVDPVAPLSKAQPDRSVARVVAERGWVAADTLERLTGIQATPTLGDFVVAPDRLAHMQTDIHGRIRSRGTAGLELALLDQHERLVVESDAEVTVLQGHAYLGAADTDAVLQHPFLAALTSEPFAPPSPIEAGVDPSVLRQLSQHGAIVQSEGIWFATTAVEHAGQIAAELLHASPDGFTMAEFRSALATTRKWALPLARALDANGVTRRRGERRIAGPRLPPVRGGGRESNPPDG
jgi:selenocysteine-specific elongation factor